MGVGERENGGECAHMLCCFQVVLPGSGRTVVSPEQVLSCRFLPDSRFLGVGWGW